jgi:ACS family tartrate transporter-like MFS transporter
LTTPLITPTALDRARRKAYLRLLPILFSCYVIAYIDRVNVSLAKLTLVNDLPKFTNHVIGIGSGLFFIGYFLLEIPGTLLVEKWSARKWICRIMITWGFIASLTAWAKTPHEFYAARFALGLAEAGFFPGVIVYMTHWFTARDRARALSWFMLGSSVAQIISPKISRALLLWGSLEHPGPLGLAGWQWVYVVWGIPAVALGIIVYLFLPDHPEQALFLTDTQKQALRSALNDEKTAAGANHRTTLLAAMSDPRVLLLAAAYFCVQSGNYGIDIFLPSILERWYSLKLDANTWLIMLTATAAVLAIILTGWNSDRTKERRLHAVAPPIAAAIALALVPLTQGHLVLTTLCFIVAAAGLKAYLAPFWALPSLFLSQTAAAGSIGLINSIGNLGGFLGPTLVGTIEGQTHSFVGGIYCLSALLFTYGLIIFYLGVGRKSS